MTVRIRRRRLAAATALLLAGVLTACSSEPQAQPAPTVSVVAPTARPGAQPAPLPAKLTPDGTRVLVGRASAPHTVSVYEDPRCPACATFETTAGPELARLTAAGKVKVEYVLASFLDRTLGGSGSARAVNALRASVDAGRFPAYHAAVFASQPKKETVDGFTPDFLLAVADQVPGLRGAAFDRAVRSHAHAAWVADAQKAYTTSGVPGAPSVVLDGKPLLQRTVSDASAFTKVLRAAGIG
ncbi:DsbA family protein [Streptomyces sp. NBC_00237]|uniref:DsbA family protein n=1 Tax=Streptomyces sp. NBC_00237 TaxID=2975687 RepID=UPI00225B9370|nr:thioredoxin domain-containing protein [Streptomyces sp. NBC_00237]MCX5205925.1 DsbA family protein [Streptomyces sp. NBC_00237]